MPQMPLALEHLVPRVAALQCVRCITTDSVVPSIQIFPAAPERGGEERKKAFSFDWKFQRPIVILKVGQRPHVCE